MHIFIDEAGSFIPPGSPESPSYSLVLALVVPTSARDALCYDFLRLRDAWPNNSVEVKGSKLNEAQCNEVALLLAAHEALIEVQIIDMGLHDLACIETFKERQAQAVTANMTPQHQPTMIHQMNDMADTFRGMSNQLFVQAFLMMQLVMETCETGMLYHVQRHPQELANFTWVIDKKDRDLTAMERAWSTFILPAGEAAFMKKRPPRIVGSDYSYFAKYEIDESTVDPKWAQKLAWIRATYPVTAPAGTLKAIDWGKLVAEDRTFADSKDSLGLQLADIAATSLRRALNGNLQKAGWEAFGNSLIHKKKAQFFMLGALDSRSAVLEPKAQAIWDALSRQAKNMVV
jgi:hypothetical protein